MDEHEHWTFEVGGWQHEGWQPSPDIVLFAAMQHPECRNVTLICFETGQRIEVSRQSYVDDSWRAQLNQTQQ
jgi:hypothetical protein